MTRDLIFHQPPSDLIIDMAAQSTDVWLGSGLRLEAAPWFVRATGFDSLATRRFRHSQSYESPSGPAKGRAAY
ncbi:MAG: hypothetical protein L0Y60_17885 [Beijerinckiaceae bacterium]|nr:hypothetical protein [Beijerinckiaceae bacterium]